MSAPQRTTNIRFFLHFKPGGIFPGLLLLVQRSLSRANIDPLYAKKGHSPILTAKKDGLCVHFQHFFQNLTIFRTHFVRRHNFHKFPMVQHLAIEFIGGGQKECK